MSLPYPCGQKREPWDARKCKSYSRSLVRATQELEGVRRFVCDLIGSAAPIAGATARRIVISGETDQRSSPVPSAGGPETLERTVESCLLECKPASGARPLTRSLKSRVVTRKHPHRIAVNVVHKSVCVYHPAIEYLLDIVWD